MALAIALMAAGLAPSVRAQNAIVEDTTLGPEASIVTAIDPDTTLITGGAQRDRNLFHSFSRFNIGVGGTAAFLDPGGDLANIFARVTGPGASEIQGTLSTLNTAANLYLINPQGIVFGEGAALNVQGSFVATTAAAIAFPSGDSYSATAPGIPGPRLTVNPSALLFNQLSGAPLEIRSTVPGGRFGLPAGLAVPTGTSLLLVGGDLTFPGGRLTAPDGYLGLGSVRGSATVPLIGPQPRLGPPEAQARGRLTLSDGAELTTVGTGTGAIAAFVGDLQLDNQSAIAAGVDFFATGGATPGSILIDASGSLTLDNRSTISSQVGFWATGQAGDVVLQAEGPIRLQNGSQITNQVYGRGDSGNIWITGASLDLVDGAQIVAANSGSAGSGNVDIQLRGPLRTSGTGQLTGVFNTVSALPNIPVSPGIRVGNITIQAQDMNLRGRSRLSTNAFDTPETVNAGNLTITVPGTVLLEGDGVILSTGTSGRGRGGTLLIQTGSFTASNGALLTSTTFGPGPGGAIQIQAEDRLTFDGVSANFIPTGAISGTWGDGDGGNLMLSARTVTISNGAQLSADTLAAGDAGNVQITAEQIRLEGVVLNFFVSGIFATSQPGATGRGGNIIIATDTLQMGHGAQINAGTGSAAAAGNVVIDATGAITVDGVGGPNIPTEIGAETGPESSGQGGSIEMRGRSLAITNGAQIRATTEGVGPGGNITLVLADLLQVQDGLITSRAARASGGDIRVRSREIRLVGDGDITTSVLSGVGGGGNITLTADTIIAFDDSDILAFAAAGAGGNITLTTPAFFGQDFTSASLGADPRTLDGNGRVDINATGRVNGVVTLPDVSDLENSLSTLPESTLVIETLLAGSCIATAQAPGGSLIATGRGNLPAQPGTLPAGFPTGPVQPLGAAISDSNAIEPTGVFALPDGRLVLSQACP